MIRVAAVQMDVRFGEVAANRDAIIERLDRAADLVARFIVFPECALTGYGFSSQAEAARFAEAIPGPSLSTIAIACAMRKVYAVVGMIERDGTSVFNTCALLGPGGVVASYRKVHMPFMGLDRFATPGNRPFAVHDAGGLRVGMHICYDSTFPEAARVLGLLGADVIVLPTNWPAGTECQAEHIMPTRCHENVVYGIVANRIGEERGFRFIGRSSIVAPDGTALARAAGDGDEILTADIDPMKARVKRIVRRAGEHEIDRIADRRPRFYGPIVAPNGRQ